MLERGDQVAATARYYGGDDDPGFHSISRRKIRKMPEKIANYTRVAESGGVSFPKMFWDSLKPFPGRGRITLRLAVVCTLIVLVAYTFKMPFQDLMPFFVLFVTKEEKVTTTITALLILLTITWLLPSQY